MRHPDGFQVLVALDQLINTFFGGMADETISSHLHRRRMRGSAFGAKLVNLIFFWQADHCKEAYESEMTRQHLPEVFR